MYTLDSAEPGLLDGCLLMFRGAKSKRSEDCHMKMNSVVFFDWLEKTVFPNLKRCGNKFVFALDRATYHTFLWNKRLPNTRKTKRDLVAAITRCGGHLDNGPPIGGYRAISLKDY